MLDLLNTITIYSFIGFIVLFALWHTDWSEAIKKWIPLLIITLIVTLFLTGQYFFILITIALCIIFWEKIPKHDFWE